MNADTTQFYDQILDQCERLATVRDTDKLVIERLAFNLYAVEQCEAQLLKEGFVTMGAHGPREHPAVSIKNKAESKMREAYILLGLDFASQLKKQISEEGKDDWEDFK